MTPDITDAISTLYPYDGPLCPPPPHREIASAIKKLLDAVQGVSAYIPGSHGKQALDHRRRDFVKYSKKFSNTLKEYFKEGQ